MVRILSSFPIALALLLLLTGSSKAQFTFLSFNREDTAAGHQYRFGTTNQLPAGTTLTSPTGVSFGDIVAGLNTLNNFQSLLSNVVGEWEIDRSGTITNFTVMPFTEDLFPTTTLVSPTGIVSLLSSEEVVIDRNTVFPDNTSFHFESSTISGSFADLAVNGDLNNGGPLSFSLLNDREEASFNYAATSFAVYDSFLEDSSGLSIIASVLLRKVEFIDRSEFVRFDIVRVPEPSTAMLALLSTVGLFFVTIRSKHPILNR